MYGYNAGNRWVHVYQRGESGEKYIMRFKATTLIEAVVKFNMLYSKNK